jgi:CHAT domain-containing protein
VPAAELYEQVLSWKGALAARRAEERLALDQPDLRPLLRRLRQARAGLARLAAAPPTPAGVKHWRQRFDELEKEKEDLQVQLADASAEYRKLRRQPTAAQVAKALPAGTALVDFLEYTHETPPAGKAGKGKAERRLLAFVLRPGRAPLRLDLGPSAPIGRAVRRWRKPLAATPPARPDEGAAGTLRRRLWLPLEEQLAGVKAVLIAPDGDLATLPFAALPGGKPGSFLIEEFAVGYVTSGRQLLDLAATRGHKGEGLLVVGGLNFGKAAPAEDPEARPRFAPWDALPGTRLEAGRVAAAFRAAFPELAAPRLVGGAAAGKEALVRALTPSGRRPRWRFLHLATHGFFDPPPPTRPRRREAGRLLFAGAVEHATFDRNPLLASGLVLAGANASEDNLLSAEEISGLDLRGCELVVLSACDTGLGRQGGWQGVHGLQRAFHEAGARALVASLWSVHDAATSVVMEEFYANLWRKKLPPLEALRRAQLAVLRDPSLVEKRQALLLARLKAEGGEAVRGLRGPGKVSVLLPEGGKVEARRRSHPAYWAAFLLSGETR